ncbi:hypothetical protein FOL47_002614 [Perkinsus chesapeaki]|uniref:Uncharacterized protein n=1 Tax=Perkinsus chesapeaki TaxID=330153 RepID=A0A7J6MDS8_PERCH|nr:hypothetical protein FOL47_002614 [Perkinsus chesapeaki]
MHMPALVCILSLINVWSLSSALDTYYHYMTHGVCIEVFWPSPGMVVDIIRCRTRYAIADPTSKRMEVSGTNPYYIAERSKADYNAYVGSFAQTCNFPGPLELYKKSFGEYIHDGVVNTLATLFNGSYIALRSGYCDMGSLDDRLQQTAP